MEILVFLFYVWCIDKMLQMYLKALPWLRGEVPAPSLASFPDMSGMGESSMGDIMFSWRKGRTKRPFNGDVSAFSQNSKIKGSDIVTESDLDESLEQTLRERAEGTAIFWRFMLGL